MFHRRDQHACAAVAGIGRGKRGSLQSQKRRAPMIEIITLAATDAINSNPGTSGSSQPPPPTPKPVVVEPKQPQADPPPPTPKPVEQEKPKEVEPPIDKRCTTDPVEAVQDKPSPRLKPATRLSNSTPSAPQNSTRAPTPRKPTLRPTPKQQHNAPNFCRCRKTDRFRLVLQHGNQTGWSSRKRWGWPCQLRRYRPATLYGCVVKVPSDQLMTKQRSVQRDYRA